MAAALINGRPADCLSIADRGLQYGDGLFETIAVHAGKAILLAQHLQRLVDGCQRLLLLPPDPADLTRRIESLARDGNPSAVIKLIITRGASGRGYAPAPRTRPTTILTRHAFPAYPDAWWRDGIAARWCDMRLGRNARLAGVKHLNRLEQVLARAEWTDSTIAEGIMRDSEAHVIEGVMSNLFILKDNCLHTPKLAESGVDGVMRRQVLKMADACGYDTRVGVIHRKDVLAADALLFSNSLIGLWPVRRLETHGFQPAAFPTKLVASARALARGEQAAS